MRERDGLEIGVRYNTLVNRGGRIERLRGDGRSGARDSHRLSNRCRLQGHGHGARRADRDRHRCTRLSESGRGDDEIVFAGQEIVHAERTFVIGREGTFVRRAASRTTIDAVATRAPVVSWTTPVRVPRGFCASTDFAATRHSTNSVNRRSRAGKVGRRNIG